MTVARRPQTCRWAEPTLHLPWPMWLDAWSWPWSCRAEGNVPRLLPTTAECQDCDHWEAREPSIPPPACIGALRGRRCGTV